MPFKRAMSLRPGLRLHLGDMRECEDVVGSSVDHDQLRIVLQQGKKRQIRRMCEQVGLKVVGLKRIRIGRVVLGQLPVGQWRYLGPHERF